MMLTAPIKVDNALPAELYAQVRDLVKHAPLTYGAKSNSKTDPYGHLKWSPVHDKQQNLADLAYQLPDGPLRDCWDHLQGKELFRGNKLVRCYANGYAYGMDGYFHTDSERPGEITAILYCCDEWMWDWAGETVCHDGKGNSWHVPPAPNRLLIIPSNMPHCARAVSRMCRELRMVLVYKTRPAQSENFEKLSDYLVMRGALDINHAKGSLHDHLVRVFAALEQRKELLPVCFGGGLHSIYGTNVFKQKLLTTEPHDRAEVANNFGAEAENLAYRFSYLKRPATLEEATNKFAACRLTTSYGEDIFLPGEEVRSLQLIECANLMDQGGLDKFPNLKRLWDGYVPDHPDSERLVPRPAPEKGAVPG